MVDGIGIKKTVIRGPARADAPAKPADEVARAEAPADVARAAAAAPDVMVKSDPAALAGAGRYLRKSGTEPSGGQKPLELRLGAADGRIAVRAEGNEVATVAVSSADAAKLAAAFTALTDEQVAAHGAALAPAVRDAAELAAASRFDGETLRALGKGVAAAGMATLAVMGGLAVNQFMLDGLQTNPELFTVAGTAAPLYLFIGVHSAMVFSLVGKKVSEAVQRFGRARDADGARGQAAGAAQTKLADELRGFAQELLAARAPAS